MLAAANARIKWVPEHPQIRDRLKQTPRTADGPDSTGLQNDVEMLKHLIVLTDCFGTHYKQLLSEADVLIS
jgi:hypothetical protein